VTLESEVFLKCMSKAVKNDRKTYDDFGGSTI
jgi:hypothetical protein